MRLCHGIEYSDTGCEEAQTDLRWGQKTILVFKLPASIHCFDQPFCDVYPPQTKVFLCVWWLVVISSALLLWPSIRRLVKGWDEQTKQERQARGNPQPAAVVFGSGYILEYNTGILAVTEPREPYIECRKANLYTFWAKRVSASQNITATWIFMQKTRPWK